jgi:putative aldouronate transport system substrate-binding protein
MMVSMQTSQAREFFDGLNDDVKEAFQAYGVETYVEMLGTNEAPGEWYPMWSFSNNFNTSTPGGMAWTKIGEVKHEQLPQVVMAADGQIIWMHIMPASRKILSVNYRQNWTAEWNWQQSSNKNI